MKETRHPPGQRRAGSPARRRHNVFLRAAGIRGAQLRLQRRQLGLVDVQVFARVFIRQAVQEGALRGRQRLVAYRRFLLRFI